MAPRSGILATKDSIDAERDRLLEDLNPYKLKNEQLRKVMLVMDALMKAISTCLQELETKVATNETEKRLPSKLNA